MNSPINFALYKEQMKRFWLGGALLTFVSVMYIVTFFTDNRHDWQIQDNIHRLVGIIGMLDNLVQVAIIVVPLALSFLLFSHLFNSSANITLHSFPVNKNQVYLTNVLVGITLIVIPVFIFSFLLWINPLRIQDPVVIARFPEIIYGRHTYFPLPFFPESMNELEAASNRIVTFSIAFGFFWRVVISKIFYFSIFSLASSLAGNRIGKLMFSGALPFIPILLLFVPAYAIQYYMVGHMISDRVPIHAIMALNPALWSEYTRHLQINHIQPFLFILYISQIVIYFAIALYCQHIRKLENTGELVVFRPIKNVVICISSAMGMVLAGFFTVSVIFDIGSRVIFYLAFIPGFVLSYIIVQMIAEKSFLVFHKIKKIVPYAVATLSAYLIMVVIATIAISTDVPRQENIAKVAISDGRSGWGALQFLSDDPEVINLVREIHQTLVDEIGYLRQTNWNNLSTANRWQRNFPISLRYQMENGREINRYYWVSNDFVVRTGLYNLLGNRALLELREPFLRYRNYIQSVIINRTLVDEVGRRSGLTIFIDDYAQVQSMLDAIGNDVMDFHIMQFDAHLTHGVRHDVRRVHIPDSYGITSFNEWHIFFNYTYDFLFERGDEFRWVWNFNNAHITRPDGYFENWLELHGYMDLPFNN